MIPTTILAAFLLMPVELTAEDRVSVVEVNNFFDEHGRLVFIQTIFWDWSPDHDAHRVRAWRLVKHHDQLPFYNHGRDRWEAVWLDGEVMRRVTAGAYRESWTQYDPELAEREYLPKEKRRELSMPPKVEKQCHP